MEPNLFDKKKHSDAKLKMQNNEFMFQLHITQ